MRKVKLVGGTRDGEFYFVNNFQRSVNIPRRVDLEEINSLAIDDVVSWKYPEEFYMRTTDGNFVYSHTINYKPEA